MAETSASQRDAIEQLADSFMTSYRAGQRPNLEAYLQRYPELAEQLRGLIAALMVLERNAPHRNRLEMLPQAASRIGNAPREIGEFTIIREIGRGGMGIVYEAVQQSLGRHVALKVLSSPGLTNPVQLERFRLEARSAGRLHHSHIVPVFGVGEHEGVHYYAMQFIPGKSLDQVIDELRKLRLGPGGARPSPQNGDELSWSIAVDLLSGGSAGGEPNAAAAAVVDVTTSRATVRGVPDDTPRVAARGSTSASRGAHAEFSTGHSGRPFFDSVARVGLQVAEALAYAHTEGILHRDIKPSNLLLDAKGNCWITDFGLAKAEESQALTATGDFVGTLRYMAPERLEGWADRRSDIYGLGAAIYELLTLRLFFDSSNRAKLIDDIRHSEPLAPTKIDAAIPRDLETIVLKSLAKEPAARYHTADELAEDLRLYLSDRPILARRSTRRERFVRWCRRNPMVASLTAAVLLLFVSGAAVSGTQVVRAVRAERDGAVRQAALSQRTNSALDEAREQFEASDWTAALESVELAEALLAEGELVPESADRARLLREDVETMLRFEEVNLDRDSVMQQWERSALEHPGYEREFRRLGVDIDKLSIEEAAARITRQRIAPQLCQVLDEWYLVRSNLVLEPGRDGWPSDGDWWRRPLAVARHADREKFRTQVRLAAENNDAPEMARLAKTEAVLRLPTSTRSLMTRNLYWSGNDSHRKLSLDVLMRCYAEHPDDFRIHTSLSNYLAQTQPPQQAEAIRFATAALAIRPRNPWVRLQLSRLLHESARGEEALVVLRKGNELTPNFAMAYNIGGALERQGKNEEALTFFRQAVALKPNYPAGFFNIGVVSRRLNRIDDSITAYRRVLEIDPTETSARNNLYHALRETGHQDEAIEVCREGMRVAPSHTMAHNLGVELSRREQFAEAVDMYRKAVELDPKFALSWTNLGDCLKKMQRPAESLDAYRQAVAAAPASPRANERLYGELRAELRLTDLVLYERNLIAHTPPTADGWLNLANILTYQYLSEQAIAATHGALEFEPVEPLAHYLHALVHLRFNDVTGYQESCAMMLEQLASTTDPETSYTLAWACGIGPRAVEDRNVPMAHARRAIVADRKNPKYLAALGVLQYRGGQFDQAARQLAAAETAFATSSSNDDARMFTLLFLALTHARLGDESAAREWLAKAKVTISQRSTEALFWGDREAAYYLRQEVEPLLPAND